MKQSEIVVGGVYEGKNGVRRLVTRCHLGEVRWSDNGVPVKRGACLCWTFARWAVRRLDQGRQA